MPLFEKSGAKTSIREGDIISPLSKFYPLYWEHYLNPERILFKSIDHLDCALLLGAHYRQAGLMCGNLKNKNLRPQTSHSM